MRILINASNIGGSGGAQVADSICRYLNEYEQHFFIAVLSSALEQTAIEIVNYGNVNVVRYNYPPRDYHSLITGRNSFLDNIVEENSVNCVLTVFGPMKWRPKCPHVCGFGMSHIVMPESPYFSILNPKDWVCAKLQILLWSFLFRRSADALFSENPLITERLKTRFKGKTVKTITNNYNQVFDRPDEWVIKSLPSFEGVQLLDVTAFGPHKNVTIALDVAKILKKEHPDFKFRFVFTFNESEYPIVPAEIRDNFLFVGKVPINEIPSLYQQCDLAFQPTLLESFTATYPEAMRMSIPIITTDLEFAHSICGEAASFYEPLSPVSAAGVIYKIANDKSLYEDLVSRGHNRLKVFNTSLERSRKIILMCEKM